jgi:hypothetical protein
MKPTKSKKTKLKPVTRVGSGTLVRRRERKAFEAGWIAGAENTWGTWQNGCYRPQHRNFADAWKHYKRLAAPPNEKS